MKMFVFPYRWLPRTLWTNLTHPYYDIKNGLRNLATFFEAVWRFRSWDCTGMLKLLEVSAREMRKDQELGIHVGDHREAKRLLIVEALCKRLIAADYFNNAGHDPKTWDSLPDHEQVQIAKHSSYMPEQDARYLGEQLRFIRNWWC